jgi:hypothetical protein
VQGMSANDHRPLVFFNLYINYRLLHHNGTKCITASETIETLVISQFQSTLRENRHNERNIGTTHLLFSPEEFIGNLVALIPPPRSHLVRWRVCRAGEGEESLLPTPHSDVKLSSNRGKKGISVWRRSQTRGWEESQDA